MSSSLVAPATSRLLWRLACAYLLAIVVVAATNEVLSGDGLDHLNSARWLLRGDSVARFIDHRPPTLTVFTLPLIVLYELLGLSADTTLRVARLSGALALAAAAYATGAACPGHWRGGVRPLAALLVASSPIAIAVAPVFYQNVFEAAGVAAVLLLYRRLHQQPSLRRAAALGFVAGCVALIRWDTGIVLGGVGLVELVLVRDWRRVVVIASTAAAAILGLLLFQFGARNGVAGSLSGFLETMRFMSEAVQVPQTHRSPLEIQGATLLRNYGPALLLLIVYGGFLALKTREPVALAALATVAVGEVWYLVIVTNTQPRFQTQFVPPAVVLACVGLAGVLRAWAPDGGRRATLLLSLAALWPVSSGAVELWAFSDPSYRRPVARILNDACEDLGGRTARVWLIGTNHWVRPLKRGGFVEGDHSTRSYTTGIGHLNFYSKAPVYFALWQPREWASLLPLEDGDVGVLVAPIAFQAWPLQRTGPVQVVAVERDDLEIRGGSVVASRGRGHVVGELRGATLRLETPSDLGTRHVVLLGPGGPRSLGARGFAAGVHELKLDDQPLTGVVLIGGVGVVLLE